MQRITTGLLALAILAAPALRAEEPAPAAPAEPAAAEPAPALTPEAEGDALFKKRGLKNFEAAVEKYEAALKADPGNKELMLKTADAINAVMRVKTNAALVPIEGGADTPRNKAIWKELGARSIELAEKATGKSPKNEREALIYAESYMYYSSSMGIIKAILEGAADQYKKNADNILKQNPKADGGVGDVYHGAFFIVAPWPMADAGKSKKHLDSALAKMPTSVRNNYYVGLRALKDENWDLAEKHFKFVVDNKCVLDSERDYCSYIKKQAEEGLAKVKAER